MTATAGRRTPPDGIRLPAELVGRVPDERLLALAVTEGDLPLTLSDAQAPDQPLVWVNEAFTRLTGYTPEDALGRNCRFLQGPATDPAAVQRMRYAVRSGRSISEVLLNYRRDGSVFWNRVVISPVHDADGQVTHLVGAQLDVTAQVGDDDARDLELELARQTSSRLDLLRAVSDELSRHLDYDTAVDALADVVVPALATWGFVAVVGERGRFERVHVVATDPRLAATAARLEAEAGWWLERSPRVRGALDSSIELVPEPMPVDRADLPSRSTPGELRLLERLGLGSSLIVQLRARDRVLGVLVLLHHEPDGFGPETAITAAHLGRRAGLALDNVQLYLAQREAALTLQQRLLPHVEPVAGLDLATAYVPSSRYAQVGGDWFDVLPLRDGAIGLAVGDVVGHDLRAAASMGQLASLMRSHAWAGLPPREVLDRLDELVQGLGMAEVATCVYLHWVPAGDHARVTYARAGHPPPMVRLPGGEVLRLDHANSTPIGLTTYTSGRAQATVDLPAGSTLVVYTDGLVERRDRGLREGVAQLEAELQAVPDDADATAVRDRLVQRLAASSQEDDLCLLVVRVPSATEPVVRQD
ncbi:MAG: histidine kinase [Cellulomonas sp. 14-74-6]|nr:MAG: histidine kinase [Cellulomonas sp. 14-74-6]